MINFCSVRQLSVIFGIQCQQMKHKYGSLIIQIIYKVNDNRLSKKKVKNLANSGKRCYGLRFEIMVQVL